jgi:hypothetical protein
MRMCVHQDGINCSFWTVQRPRILLGSALEATPVNWGIGLLTLTSPRLVFSQSIHSCCHSFIVILLLDFKKIILIFIYATVYMFSLRTKYPFQLFYSSLIWALGLRYEVIGFKRN